VELTYPTWGKGTSSSKVPLKGDMLVPRRVYKYIFALLRKLSSKPTRTSGIFSRWSDKERLRGLSESPFSKMEVYFWDIFFSVFLSPRSRRN